MTLYDLFEGTIKVPNKAYTQVKDFCYAVLLGKLAFYLDENFKKEVSHEDDIEDFKLMYQSDIETFQDGKKYLSDPSYARKFASFYNLSERTTIIVSEDDMNIAGYPSYNDGDIPIDVVVEFEDKIHRPRASIAYKKQIGGEFQITIKLVVPYTFRVIGKNSKGDDVYTFEKYEHEASMKAIESIIRHELMHLVQDFILHLDQAKMNYDSNTDLSSLQGLKDYFTSPNEFQPTIVTIAAKYHNRYGDDQTKVNQFIKDETFFNILRKHAPSRYNVAKTKLYHELSKLKES